MLGTVKQTVLRAFDPHLGHGYLSANDLRLLPDEELIGGCVRLGPGDADVIRIGVLGGSTSDVSYAGSWLRPFREICLDHHRDVTLYSGAVSGYSSAQELVKFIRDLLPLKPRLVISLSGLNDVGFIHAGGPEYPMVHSYQKRLGRWLARKPGNRGFFEGRSAMRPAGLTAFNEQHTIEGVVMGARNTLSAARVWERNLMMIRALCQDAGTAFRGFLQPAVGVGEYVISADETASFVAYGEEMRKVGFEYAAELRAFYSEARTIVHAHPECMADLVDVFRGESGMYADVRHPNDAGNQHIATQIFARCRDLL